MLAIVPDRSVVGCLKFVIKCFITNITCIHLPMDTCYYIVACMHLLIEIKNSDTLLCATKQRRERTNLSSFICIIMLPLLHMG